MIIVNNEILDILTTCLNRSRNNLNFIIYTISPASPRSTLKFKIYWQALIRACHRVEKAEIILCGWPENSPQFKATNDAKKILETAGAEVRLSKVGVIMHPKTFLFDDEFLIIGSHNATEAGLNTSKNLSILSSEQHNIERYKDFFNFEWSRLKKI